MYKYAEYVYLIIFLFENATIITSISIKASAPFSSEDIFTKQSKLFLAIGLNSSFVNSTIALTISANDIRSAIP